MNKKGDKIQKIRLLEHHLRHYQTYKVGIKNLQKQLDFIMPSMTATYDVVGGSSGTFNIMSKTEKYAIDRIESRRALDIHEDIRRYGLIIDSIDSALEELEEMERGFVEYRYFKGLTIKETSIELGYSEKYIFNLRTRVFNKLLISLIGIINCYCHPKKTKS